jgi:hypothetical protein
MQKNHGIQSGNRIKAEGAFIKYKQVTQRHADATTATGHGQGVCVEEQSGA